MVKIKKKSNYKKIKSLLKKNFPGVFSPTSANIFVIFMLAFLVGVVIRSLVEVSNITEIIIAVVLLLTLVRYFFNHTNRKNLLIIFMLVGLIIGIVRTDLALQKSVGWLDLEYDSSGVMVRFPEEKDDYQRIYMEIEGQKQLLSSKIIKQKEKVILFASLGIKYQYGEKYNLKCKLKTAENKYDKFNYVRFLASKKVYQICSGAKIKKIRKDIEKMNKNNIIHNRGMGVFSITIGYLQKFKIKMFRNIYNINKTLEQKINKLFPMPESAYLAGLLLGGDNRLPKKVAENFRRTGTTHTVAVSGYNITILANVFMWLGIGIGLWRKQAFWFVVGSIIIFIIMIGAPSSAVRAGIMGIILLQAAQLGRLANSLRVIILTAVVMVFLSPLILLYDAGFQLSFMATLGIVLIYGPLSEKFKIENDFLGLKSIILVTISAQLGVLGILIYTFDSISLISLLANVIILPALPMIMLGGAVAIGGSFILKTLGIIFALPTWAMLHLEVMSIEKLANVSWAIVEFNGISIWWSIAYYIILGIVLLVIRINNFLVKFN